MRILHDRFQIGFIKCFDPCCERTVAQHEYGGAVFAREAATKSFSCPWPDQSDYFDLSLLYLFTTTSPSPLPPSPFFTSYLDLSLSFVPRRQKFQAGAL
jgi:hypothetical protein